MYDLRGYGAVIADSVRVNAFFNPMSANVREVVHTDCVSTVSNEGAKVREVFAGIDGRRSIADLAVSAFVDHPDRFEYEEDAVSFVRDVVERFGKATLLIDD